MARPQRVIRYPRADGTYYAVSARRAADGKRIVLGGSHDLSKIEDWIAANTGGDNGWGDHLIHHNYKSFAHAIRGVEHGK